MKITQKNLAAYLKGSQFLATGGGLPFTVHKKIFQSVFAHRKFVEPILLKNLESCDVIASVYGVGDPSIIPRNFSDMAVGAFVTYKKLTGYDIKGIVPGEIGAEGLSFLIAQYADMPVIDADLVGGRAAPEIQLDVFTVCNLSITPVLLMALNGKSIFLNGAFSAKEIEKISRDFFVKNGSSGLLIGYGVSVHDFAQCAIQNTLTLAMRIGTTLLKKDMQGMLNDIGGKILCKTTIIRTSLHSLHGFLCGTIKCKDGIMIVKNENMIFTDAQGKKWCAPDILVCVDEKYNPIHNANIDKYVGKAVYVVYAPAIGYWKRDEAKEMWKI